MKIVEDNPVDSAAQIQELFLEDQALKESMYRVWEQNIHFLNGQQTLEWDQYNRRFHHVPVTNRKTSRPQMYITNEIEPIVRTLVSFLTRNKPTATVYPSDMTSDDSVRRAKMAEMVQRATWEMDHEYDRYVLAAYWILTTGTVFRKDFWDSTARGQVHFEQEVGAPTLPNAPALGGITGNNNPLGAAIASENGVQMPSGLGQPQEGGEPESQHWGDMGASILSPFQMAVDFNVTEFSAASWVMEYSLQQVDWVKEQFGFNGNGYTGRVEDVKEETQFGKALQLDLDMRFQTAMQKGSRPKMSKMCVLKEFYQAPRKDMSWNSQGGKMKGRMIIAASGITLYDGPSLYDWHPYTCGGYEPYIGRFWFKSLVEQLISIQRRLNEINGAILENAQTMANPQWLVPEGTIREGIISGKHGLVIPWKIQPHGQKPERLQGIPLPQQYFNERNGLIEALVRIAGSNAVMSGAPPTGVTAASALQLLLENAQTQHGTLINQWELFIERSQTKKLQNFQSFGKEPRDDIVKFLKRLDSNTTNLDVDAIIGEELEPGVTVCIEAGSSVPKSQAAHQQQIQDIAKMAQPGQASPLGDVINDPVARNQFLTDLGIKEYDRENNSEMEKIKWEIGRMLKGQPPAPSQYDQHELHIKMKVAEVQKPVFIEEATPQVKMLFQQNIEWHQQQIAMAQQAQAAQQAQQAVQAMAMKAGAQAGPPPAPPPGPPAGAPMLQ